MVAYDLCIQISRVLGFGWINLLNEIVSRHRSSYTERVVVDFRPGSKSVVPRYVTSHDRTSSRSMWMDRTDYRSDTLGLQLIRIAFNITETSEETTGIK